MTNPHSPKTPRAKPGAPKRCIVHFGMAKTGTTSIQGWLAQNRRALAAEGIVYDPVDGPSEQALWKNKAFAITGLWQVKGYKARPGIANHFACSGDVIEQATAARYVDRFNVRLVERDFLVGGDLIRDFASVIGASGVETERVKTRNEALGRSTMSAMSLANGIPLSAVSRAVRFILTRIARHLPNCRFTISAKDQLWLAKLYADANARLRTAFFPDRELLFAKSHALLSDVTTESDRDALDQAFDMEPAR